MRKYLIVLIAIACLFSSCSLFGSETPKLGEISPDIDNIVGTWVSELIEVYLDNDGSSSVYTCTTYTFYSDGKVDKATIDLPKDDFDAEPLSSFVEHGTYQIYPGSEQIVLNIEYSSELTYSYSIEQDGDEYYLILDNEQYTKR